VKESLDIEVLRAANATVATPGDTILITFNRALSVQEIEIISGQLREGIHPDIVLCIMDQVQSVTVVKK
jgi:hypothetical protein